MPIRVLSPGILAIVRHSIKGGVEHQKTILEEAHETASGKTRERYEMIVTVDDPAERKLATEAAGKARAQISKLCAQTEFGLLCPLSREPELEAGVRVAEQIIADFNARASTCRISFYALPARIAKDEREAQQAARAIGEDLQRLVADMLGAIRAATKPEEIRAAAAQAAKTARQLANMIDAGTLGKVDAAVKAAREAATDLAARIREDGAAAAGVVGEIQARSIKMLEGVSFLDMDNGPVASDSEGSEIDRLIADARMAGLDLSEPEPAAVKMIAPVVSLGIVQAPVMDLAPAGPPAPAPAAHAAMDLDLS